MKPNFKKVAATLLGVCCAVVLFYLSSSKVTKMSMPHAPFAVGTEDNPHARWEYEFMMLRDPKTGTIPEGIRAKELAFARALPSREAMLAKGQAAAALTWTRRGPYNVGGRTRALAIDVSNENIILAGGVSGGMWRSTDGGASWTRTTDLSNTVQSVTCIAQDTRQGKQSIWYYGTGEFKGNSANGVGARYLGDGIYKSTDGGRTWFVLTSTTSGTPHLWDGDFDYVWNIAIDASSTSPDGEVYAAIYGGIKRSTDGGLNWANTLVADAVLQTGSYTDVAVTATGVVYATISSDGSTTRGIFRSTDGINWTDITPAGWPTTYRRIVIGIAPSNENIVYFLAETPGSGKKDHSLWKYTYLSGTGAGSGGNWENRSANLPAFGGSVGDFDSQSSYDLVIKVKPDNPDVVLIGGTNLYRSTNGFATSSATTWIAGYSPANDISTYPNHHPDQHAVVFLPSNANVVFSGHDGGVSKTTDILASTVSWQSLNNGYYTTQFYAAAVDQGTAGSNIVIGGMQDNGTWFGNSTSATANWKEIFGGDGGFCAIADGATSYYVSSQNGTTYRFLLDNSGTLSGWTNVTPADASGFLFIAPFVLDPNDNRKMYMAAGGTIWRNSDLTTIPLGSNDKTTVNWDSLTASSVTTGVISSLAVSKVPANRLYFGTSDGQLYRMDNANGSNPTRTTITGSSFPTGAYVSCIAVDPTNADNLIAVFSNYQVISLWSSSNGGSSWTAVAGNLEQFPDGTGNGPSVRWASILPTGSSKLYLVGTSVGVYSTATLNGMNTVWALEGESTVGRVVVPMVVSRPLDGFLVAATHANGLFTASGITAGTATKLAFTVQPTNTTVSSIITPAVKVAIQDASGNTVTTSNANVTITLGNNPTGATLSGTTTVAAVNGVATFSSLSIDKVGTGYTLIATSASLTSTTSNSFDITAATSVVQLENRVPQDFELSQNYPNPFNPSTTIRFALPRETEVELKIYNVSGQEVATLVQEKLAAGTYTVQWNGKTSTGQPAASGMYLYRLRSENKVVSKKLLLLR
jgi:hypothetical protein